MIALQISVQQNVSEVQNLTSEMARRINEEDWEESAVVHEKWNLNMKT
jgi:protein-arginine kinase activator protein McsA